MHNGFVNIDNEKMSKSLGNFFTIREVLQQFDAETIRFFIVRAHYRSPLNYSDVHLDDARGALRRLYTALDAVPPADVRIDWNEPCAARFKAAMDNDFGTPEAVAVLFELAAEANRTKSPQVSGLLKALAGTIGLLQREPRAFLRAGAALDDATIQKMIDARAAAKKAKDFAEADRIRQELLAQGHRAEGLGRGHHLGSEAMSVPDGGVTPEYWDEARKYLTRRDRVMKRLIPQYGDACLQSRGEAFTTLARSIVGQQISVKAAQSVWDKFAALPRRMTPANVLKLKVDDMRAAGLSARKIEYLVDLALHFDSGAIHVDAWRDMQDEDIIAELVGIRGIGRWTAEMFLIFHLMRPNVLPLDDVGLITGISKNYFSGDPVSRSDAREVAAAWNPYCSVATWYIWRSLDPLPVAY
jgi:DNA-3-methyladenine glycosylase II